MDQKRIVSTEGVEDAGLPNVSSSAIAHTEQMKSAIGLNNVSSGEKQPPLRADEYYGDSHQYLLG